MTNNIVFTTILVLFAACIYIFETDMIEGYLISGSNVNNTYNQNERTNQM